MLISPGQLPRVGVIKNAGSQKFFGEWSDLSGKRLLCIGFSEAEIDDLVAPYEPASITLLAYWVDHIDAQSTKYETVIGDITKRTTFEDGAFDAVLTLSVLEHVSNVELALAEMRRVIRRGGEMIHMFGPAWSCAYGHHIYADANDPNVNFVKWEMPAHMHLLCSLDGIENYFKELGYPLETSRMVWHWFHEADHINRWFFDDYMKVFGEYQIERLELIYNDLPPCHTELLRKTFYGRKDFSTYGGKFKLLV